MQVLLKVAIASACWSLLAPLHAAAQSTPPAQGQFGYRVQVEGPQQATAGAEVNYQISYVLVDPAWAAGLGMEVSWPSAEASLASATAVSGPPGTATQPPGLAGAGREAFRWDLQRDGSGVLSVVLRISNGFAGDLTVGVDFAGTQIQLPPNSITSATTRVTPALPSTGQPAGATVSGPGRLMTLLPAALFGLLGTLLVVSGYVAPRCRLRSSAKRRRDAGHG